MKKVPYKTKSFLAANQTVLGREASGAIYRENGMEEWVLNLTTRGKGRINRGTERFTVVPGDLLIFKPLIPHDYSYADSAGAWTHLWVHFSPRAEWYDWLQWPEERGGVLRLSSPHKKFYRTVRERLQFIIRQLQGPLRRRREFALSALGEILLWCDAENPRSNEQLLDTRIRLVLEYLCDHYAESLTIPQIAAVGNLSPSRLSHKFKEDVGMSPMQYVERHRVKRAQDDLLMTAKPISQIAYEVGYQDPLYFSRVFRRHAGVSPRTFRQKAFGE